MQRSYGNCGLPQGDLANDFLGGDDFWGCESRPFALLSGDPYPERDSVTRSVPPEVVDLVSQALPFANGLSFEKFGGKGYDFDNEDSQRFGEGSCWSEFTDDREIPCRPRGVLEPTSVTLRRRASPALVMNGVREFLAEEVKSSITKVRPHKFWIKATVFWMVRGAPTPCTLKVRAVRVLPDSGGDEEASVVIEFCRYGGDVFAFDEAFKALRERIDRDFDTGGAVGDRPRALDELADDAQSEADLRPLVDMLANPAAPGLQAESLRALAALANASAAGAVPVCAAVAGAHGVFAGLLASAATLNLELAYGAACVLSRLPALVGTAESSAGIAALASAALPATAAQGTAQLVRRELAQAVHGAALYSSGVASASPSTCELRSGLKQVLQEPGVEDVRKPLREALFVLDQRQACR